VINRGRNGVCQTSRGNVGNTYTNISVTEILINCLFGDAISYIIDNNITN
jgi:hypothetical protein